VVASGNECTWGERGRGGQDDSSDCLFSPSFVFSCRLSMPECRLDLTTFGVEDGFKRRWAADEGHGRAISWKESYQNSPGVSLHYIRESPSELQTKERMSECTRLHGPAMLRHVSPVYSASPSCPSWPRRPVFLPFHLASLRATYIAGVGPHPFIQAANTPLLFPNPSSFALAASPSSSSSSS
jgi:hypothetical protein